MKKLILIVMLVSISIFGKALDKLEQAYLNKAEKLQSDHNIRAEANDEKLAKDSQRLAEAYLKALRNMLVAETKKGDFDSAVKVKAKITEIEALVNIGAVGHAGRDINPVRSKKRPLTKPKKIVTVGELAKFNGVWEITGYNETIIYEIKNNEVWHKFIENGSNPTYSTPQKVKYLFIDGFLGMQHIGWKDGKPQGDKYNWIDLKKNRAIHTNQKDLSETHSIRKLRLLNFDKLTDKQIEKLLTGRTYAWGAKQFTLSPKRVFKPSWSSHYKVWSVKDGKLVICRAGGTHRRYLTFKDDYSSYTEPQQFKNNPQKLITENK